MSQLTLPAKSGDPRVPVSEAPDKDLLFWGKRLSEALEKDPNKPYADKDRALVDAIRAELEARKESGRSIAPVRQQRPPVTSIARAPSMSMGKAIQDPGAVSRMLQESSENYHLVSPSTSVDMLPAGCGVAISYVSINPDAGKDGPKEVYDVGGRLGLGIDALKRIAAAAGLDWDPQLSGRLDDGRDPHYCHYRAVGKVRSFDGSVRTVTGEVEMDMRDGSPQVEEIKQKSEASARKYNKTSDGGASQIRELRKFLLRHAESKAKNRAIADMGVRRSYAPNELTKPFAVARLVWTGETSDPELRRVFAEKTADMMIGGMSALYGGSPPLPQRQLQAAQFSGHAAPPVGTVGSVDAYGEPYDEMDRGDDPDNY